MGVILSLQGLAVAHARLRARPNGMVLLAVIYFLVGLLGWPLVLFIFIGLADLVFDFRHRKPSDLAKPSDNVTPKAD
jgi:uncharacterized protein YybS (DUF2232 family)